MSGVLFSGSAGPVTSIVNYYSSGGVASMFTLVPSDVNNIKEVLAPTASLAAATLDIVVNLTGRGRVNELLAYVKDATARTIRCKVTVDGVVIFDATSSSIINAGYGLIVISAVSGSSAITQVFQPIDYQTSLKIEIASSIGPETSKIAIGINREVWA